MEFPVRHFIRVDDNKRIIAHYTITNSTQPPEEDSDILNWTQEGGHLPIFKFSDGSFSDENPTLKTSDDIPLYKEVDTLVVERTEEEIEEDREALPPEPEPGQQSTAFPPSRYTPEEIVGAVEGLLDGLLGGTL